MATQSPRLASLLNEVYPDRTMDPWLMDLARIRAEELLTTFAHRPLPDVNVSFGECIAYTTRDDPEARFVYIWQNSATHHAILSRTDRPVIGCGVAERNGTTYGVAIVANRAIEVPAPVVSELDRFYQLLEQGIGFSRTIDHRLEYQAARRAFEARQQVGLTYTGTDADLIKHPPQDVREDRLGLEWNGAGVAEVATWGYQWLKPIEALVDYTTSSGKKVGLLNSEPHNTILRDTRFKHMGAGIYSELPPGEPELNRRRYAIVWLSVEAPKLKAVVVNGVSYADAITAGPLAARNGASIFLTQKSVLPAATKQALIELGPDEIVIVGGLSVVDEAVEAALESVAPVSRIAGATRYETAALVSKA